MCRQFFCFKSRFFALWKLWCIETYLFVISDLKIGGVHGILMNRVKKFGQIWNFFRVKYFLKQGLMLYTNVYTNDDYCTWYTNDALLYTKSTLTTLLDAFWRPCDDLVTSFDAFSMLFDTLWCLIDAFWRFSMTFETFRRILTLFRRI